MSLEKKISVRNSAELQENVNEENTGEGKNYLNEYNQANPSTSTAQEMPLVNTNFIGPIINYGTWNPEEQRFGVPKRTREQEWNEQRSSSSSPEIVYEEFKRKRIDLVSSAAITKTNIAFSSYYQDTTFAGYNNVRSNLGHNTFYMKPTLASCSNLSIHNGNMNDTQKSIFVNANPTTSNILSHGIKNEQKIRCENLPQPVGCMEIVPNTSNARSALLELQTNSLNLNTPSSRDIQSQPLLPLYNLVNQKNLCVKQCKEILIQRRGEETVNIRSTTFNIFTSNSRSTVTIMPSNACNTTYGAKKIVNNISHIVPDANLSFHATNYSNQLLHAESNSSLAFMQTNMPSKIQQRTSQNILLNAINQGSQETPCLQDASYMNILMQSSHETNCLTQNAYENSMNQLQNPLEIPRPPQPIYPNEQFQGLHGVNFQTQAPYMDVTYPFSVQTNPPMQASNMTIQNLGPQEINAFDQTPPVITLDDDDDIFDDEQPVDWDALLDQALKDNNNEAQVAFMGTLNLVPTPWLFPETEPQNPNNN